MEELQGRTSGKKPSLFLDEINMPECSKTRLLNPHFGMLEKESAVLVVLNGNPLFTTSENLWVLEHTKVIIKAGSFFKYKHRHKHEQEKNYD